MAFNSMIPTAENSNTEFKTSFSDEVIITLVAFSNAKGGSVYIGVTDKAEVKGVDIGKETIQNWVNEIKIKTAPQIIPDVEEVVLDNKTVVILSVGEFPIKPVSTKGRYYKRVGNSNHLMSASEISDLYMQTMQYSWDSYPYLGAHIDDLNLEKVKTFIFKVNQVKRFLLPENPVDALFKLNMIKGETPTNAAMILFSKENLRYNVHIGRFKTPSMIIADKMINGNLFDVLEEAMQTIVGHLKFAFEITGRTTQRTEIPEYPLDAIRELLLNALVHRDYQSPTDIQIRIYDNSITFFNPSGLFGNITEDQLKTDNYQASTRNKQIAEVFYLTNDIEKYGSGFIRIRKAIAEYPTMKFSFRNSGHGFLTEFSYENQKTTVETTVETILKLIENDPSITQQQIMQKLKLTRRGVEWNIMKLKEKGVIIRRGPSRGEGGYWEIIGK